MKSFLFAFGVLLLCSLLVFINAYCVSTTIKRTYHDLISMGTPTDFSNTFSFDENIAAIKKLETEWQKKIHFISYSVSHEDLHEVTTLIGKLKGATESKNESNYAIYYHALCVSLQHLEKSAALCIDNIF